MLTQKVIHQATILGVLVLMIENSHGINSNGGMYFYKDPRYQNKLPVSGLINLTEDERVPLQICAALCRANLKCLAIFYSEAYCKGMDDLWNAHTYEAGIPSEGTEYYEISGSLHNIALHKPTEEGSFYHHLGEDLHANRTVDGIRNGLMNAGSLLSCFMATTKPVENKYFYVDLQLKYFVTVVKMQTRADCCPTRLTRVEISVSDDELLWERCNYYIADGTIYNGKMIPVNCGKAGRFVKLHKLGPGGFVVCEVEVSGYLIP